MSAELFDEYRQWEPRAKLELIDSKLIISKSLTHSRLLKLCGDKPSPLPLMPYRLLT